MIKLPGSQASSAALDLPPKEWLLMAASVTAEQREQEFQSGIRSTDWFKEFKTEHGEEPNLNDPDYDYRRAWREGARPDVRDKSDKNRLHWPSKYKGDNHPRRFIEGQDTRE